MADCSTIGAFRLPTSRPLRHFMATFPKFRTLVGAGVLASAALLAFACARRPASSGLLSADAAKAVYVAPGEYDEFYAFMSGGFNGQVGVYGLPPGRRP